jgi:SAM-dependent methyltransferase
MDDLLELTSRAEATHFWFHGFRAFVAPVLADLAAGRHDLRLIDCGCGTGFNLALLRPYGEVYGFDLTAGGLMRARAMGRPLVRADVTRVPFASNTFDVATSFDVLQSIGDASAAMREMARIVRPGGVVVLSVAALEMLRGDHSEAWKEVHRYTRRTARRLVEEADLRVERMSFLFASLVPMMFAVRLVQRLTRPFREHRADTDISVPAAPLNAALTSVVRAEAALARRVSMPIGSSLLVVARKI